MSRWRNDYVHLIGSDLIMDELCQLLLLCDDQHRKRHVRAARWRSAACCHIGMRIVSIAS